MSVDEKVNILLVDDQPDKLTYETILSELGENLIKAGSGREALEYLLKTDVAVVLTDVSMPDLDGFELAELIHQHPRYQKMAIIFVSAVHLTDLDRLKGYERGAVDYIAVPIIPAILRAKVSVFAELYRKTRQLERLNRELEQRVTERTAALEASTARLRQALQDKEVLLQEIHHRVKNNLQIVSSLLSLQEGTLCDAQALAAVRESRTRLRAMALIHELLHQSTSLARIDFAEYLQKLAGHLVASYLTDHERVRIAFETGPVALSLDAAIPCGLIAHELIANALQHAFPYGRSGTITLLLQYVADTTYLLTVADTGVGMPQSFDINQPSSLGLKLVYALAKQLHGALHLERRHGETVWTLKFTDSSAGEGESDAAA
jgi:two-component sensor histidine kinase